jgi:hypothetical protein
MEPGVYAQCPRPLVPRNLDAPLRSLPKALEEIIRSLMVEFLDPSTSRRGQLEITSRLAIVRSVAGEGNYTVLVGRIRASLLTA